MPVEFLITCLVVCITPGTGVLYTLSCALARGPGPGIAAAFGCTLGVLPHVAASLLGLAAILHTSALAFGTLKYAGAAYLLFLAWRTLREAGALAGRADLPAERSGPGGGRIVLRAVLVNLLNPKLSIFFLAFLPQFVPATAEDALWRMMVLSVAFMAMTFAVFVVYALAAAAARRHVLRRPTVLRWLDRCFAGAFALLGLRLALTER